MVDPKSVREVNIVIDEFKDSVRGQFADQKRYFFWVLGLLGIVVGVGVTILKQVGDVETQVQKQGGELRTEFQKQIGEVGTEIQKQVGGLRSEGQTQLGELKTSIALANQTLGRLDKSVADLVTAQRQTVTTLVRVETLLQARSGIRERPPAIRMEFDEKERSLIQRFIPTKAVPGVIPTVKVGDDVDPAMLKAVPDELAAAIPRLKGARFFIDEKSGSLVVVAAGDDRVAAIVVF